MGSSELSCQVFLMALLPVVALLVSLVQRTIARYIMGSRYTVAPILPAVIWDSSQRRPWKIASTRVLLQMGVLMLAIPEVYAI